MRNLEFPKIPNGTLLNTDFLKFIPELASIASLLKEPLVPVVVPQEHSHDIPEWKIHPNRHRVVFYAMALILAGIIIMFKQSERAKKKRRQGI